MKIAVLGCGSLIWNYGSLQINDDQWHAGGPLLPVEFARISGGSRLTLVIKPGWQEVNTLFAISGFDNLDEAVENLWVREGAGTGRVGFYNFLNGENHLSQANQAIVPALISWGKNSGTDAVIWTDLPPNFTDKTGLAYNHSGITTFFTGLNENESSSARIYVENAPLQVDTRFRSGFQLIIEQAGNRKLPNVLI